MKQKGQGALARQYGPPLLGSVGYKDYSGTILQEVAD